MRAIILQAPIMRLPVLALASTLLFCGCVYRMNIQQGNYLEAKAIDQLQTGMTRSQVRYLLGTPMVPDAFDNDRWDYVYYLKKGRMRAPQQRHLIVHFETDKVAAVDRISVPTGATLPMPDAQQPPPAGNPSAAAPSEPTATQPENPGATQPGTPQTPSPQPQPTAEEPPPEPPR